MLHAGLLKDRDRERRQPAREDGGAPDWPRRMAELAAKARDPRLRRYYEAGCIEPDTPLSRTPLIALDVETTGLDPATDGIVSIGLVPIEPPLIRASRSRHWIVKPRVPLDDESVTFHQITHSQVRQAPDLLEILGDVLEAIAGRVLVVHCRAIERQFLDQALRRRIDEGIEFPVVDTMELEARVHRGRPPGLLERLRGRRPEPVSIRLADSRRRYGLPRYSPHHAMTDALATAELLQAQIAHRYTPQTPISEIWN